MSIESLEVSSAMKRYQWGNLEDVRNLTPYPKVIQGHFRGSLARQQSKTTQEEQLCDIVRLKRQGFDEVTNTIYTRTHLFKSIPSKVVLEKPEGCSAKKTLKLGYHRRKMMYSKLVDFNLAVRWHPFRTGADTVFVYEFVTNFAKFLGES
ncbi:hypothetical protein B0O99DRAFT_602528 [Bisporella sp. PMI_857]|nr:hypothetical protein B0O99DRAFT_602528 [Bisporella sp. PMI_857]